MYYHFVFIALGICWFGCLTGLGESLLLTIVIFTHHKNAGEEATEQMRRSSGV